MRTYIDDEGNTIIVKSLDEIPPMDADESARLAEHREEDFHYGDIPPTPDEFWAVAPPFPTGPKDLVSIRLDRVVIEHFKAQGPRDQSRINAVLRSYVMAQMRAEAEKSKETV